MLYHGFEIDLTKTENELFAKMTSACRRCIRKAEKEGIFVEVGHDVQFADEYYAQLQDVFAKQRLLPSYDLQRVRQPHPPICNLLGIFYYFGLVTYTVDVSRQGSSHT